MFECTLIRNLFEFFVEAVANADEMLGEIFLEERVPTVDELTVRDVVYFILKLFLFFLNGNTLYIIRYFLTLLFLINLP